MSTPSRFEKLLEFAHGLLDETDAIALAHFRAGVVPERKPDRTLVTLADTDVESLVRSRIAEAHPTHGVVGEEFDDTAADAEIAWIVDPIDATHNFVRGIGLFATLLACRVAGEPVIGLVSAPAMGARWWATAGGVAWCRDGGGQRRIGVSGIGRLQDGQFLYGDARAIDGRAIVAAGRAWRSRGFGDFWSHMLVASGSAEAMVEDGVRPYDMAAPYVIVNAAGGRMTDLEGRPSWTDQRLLSSNGLVHDEVLAILRGDA